MAAMYRCVYLNHNHVSLKLQGHWDVIYPLLPYAYIIYTKLCVPHGKERGGLKLFVPNELAQENMCSLRDYMQSATQITEMNNFPTKRISFARRGNSHEEGVALGVDMWRTSGV